MDINDDNDAYDDVRDDKTLKRSKKLLEKSIYNAKHWEEQFIAAASAFNSEMATSIGGDGS